MNVNWELYGFVIRSKHRSKALTALDIFKTPSQVAREIKISLTHASKTLRELERKQLVICLNPNASKGRVYKRTEEGERISRYLKKAQSS